VRLEGDLVLELLAAHRALDDHYLHVGQQVLLQVFVHLKCFRALLAGVPNAVPMLGPLVSLQHRVVCKPCLTLRTLVRFLAGVHANVLGQVRGSLPRLRAVVADVTLPGVRVVQYVPTQVAIVFERLSTERALEGPDGCVAGFVMLSQCPGVGKGHTTGTHVRPVFPAL